MSEVLCDFPKPHPVQLRGSKVAAFLLRCAGWRIFFEGLPSRQGVLVVYPHTSNWDFIVLMLAKWSVGLQASFWAKDTLFRIPLFGRWLRWIGGEPVLRHAPGGVVKQAVEVIQRKTEHEQYFWLGLSPEGTRKPTPGWRSGFYQTAVSAGVPLGVFRLDFARKEIDARSFVKLCGDLEVDFGRIRRIMAGVQGFLPGNAAPIQLIERRK